MPDSMPEGMPDKVPEDLPDRMPDRMSEDMPEDMPGRMPEDMPEDMPDRMPEDMPDKMPEDMSDRMPEDLPVTKRINVMVGITRSKVICSRMPHVLVFNWIALSPKPFSAPRPGSEWGWRAARTGPCRETTWGSSLFSTSDE